MSFSFSVKKCHLVTITSRLCFIRERSLGCRGSCNLQAEDSLSTPANGKAMSSLDLHFPELWGGMKASAESTCPFQLFKAQMRYRESVDLGVLVLACDLSTGRLRQEEGKFIAQPELQSETLCLYDSKYQIK